MSKTPRALILEPKEKWQNIWNKELKGIVQLVFANYLDEAELLFDNLTDIDIVVVTCSDLRDMEKTIEWTHEIQDSFGGAMIPIGAASGLESTRQKFKEAKCRFTCERELVPSNILDALHL